MAATAALDNCAEPCELWPTGGGSAVVAGGPVAAAATRGAVENRQINQFRSNFKASARTARIYTKFADEWK
jgi:hypothetical protein